MIFLEIIAKTKNRSVFMKENLEGRSWLDMPIQWKKSTSALMSINALFWHNKQKQCPGDGYIP